MVNNYVKIHNHTKETFSWARHYDGTWWTGWAGDNDHGKLTENFATGKEHQREIGTWMYIKDGDHSNKDYIKNNSDMKCWYNAWYNPDVRIYYKDGSGMDEVNLFVDADYQCSYRGNWETNRKKQQEEQQATERRRQLEEALQKAKNRITQTETETEAAKSAIDDANKKVNSANERAKRNEELRNSRNNQEEKLRNEQTVQEENASGDQKHEQANAGNIIGHESNEHSINGALKATTEKFLETVEENKTSSKLLTDVTGTAQKLGTKWKEKAQDILTSKHNRETAQKSTHEKLLMSIQGIQRQAQKRSIDMQDRIDQRKQAMFAFEQRVSKSLKKQRRQMNEKVIQAGKDAARYIRKKNLKKIPYVEALVNLTKDYVPPESMSDLKRIVKNMPIQAKLISQGFANVQEISTAAIVVKTFSFILAGGEGLSKDDISWAADFALQELGQILSGSAEIAELIHCELSNVFNAIAEQCFDMCMLQFLAASVIYPCVARIGKNQAHILAEMGIQIASLLSNVHKNPLSIRHGTPSDVVSTAEQALKIVQNIMDEVLLFGQTWAEELDYVAPERSTDWEIILKQLSRYLFMKSFALESESPEKARHNILGALSNQEWYKNKHVLILKQSLLNMDICQQEKLCSLINTHNLKPETVIKGKQLIEFIQESVSEDTFQAIERAALSEPERSIDELIKEIASHLSSQEVCDLKTTVEEVKNMIVNGSDSSNFSVLSSKIYRASCGVHKFMGYWPRTAQLMSIALLLKSMSQLGQLLQISTGEGKSCVIAVTTCCLLMSGQGPVDIISSSEILAERDAEKWKNFYNYMKCTVCNNTSDSKNMTGPELYAHDVIYGTVSSFASDILRDEFEMRGTRGGRKFGVVIVDEVDSLLLDQGVQFTYLSTQLTDMKLLDPIFATIYCYIKDCLVVLDSSGNEVVLSEPTRFMSLILYCFKLEKQQINLQETCGMAEEKGFLPLGFSEVVFSDKKGGTKEEKETLMQKQDSKLKEITLKNLKDTLNFFMELNSNNPQVPNFAICEVQNGALQLQQLPQHQNEQDSAESPGIEGNGPNIQKQVFQVVLCHAGLYRTVYSDIPEFVKQISGIIFDQICFSREADDFNPEKSPANKNKLFLPLHMKPLVEGLIETWVHSAVTSLKFHNGRDYLIGKDIAGIEDVTPVDYQNTGVIQQNMRWSDGLQQFLQLQNSLRLTPLSMTTNYLSNLAFFRRYSGRIMGVSGTLGDENEQEFLSVQYGLKITEFPTYKRRKLLENDGSICSDSDWLQEIQKTVKYMTHEAKRAVLVICEDINNALKISEDLKKISRKIKIYTKGTQAIDLSVAAGEIIVATNLAGRGTDIRVDSDVNSNGGLFVIVSFLPKNRRVEEQAFGRTARVGSPGSAQLIINASYIHHIDPEGRSTIPGLKAKRDQQNGQFLQLMKDTELKEVAFKEALFEAYCKRLSHIAAELQSTSMQQLDFIIEILNQRWAKFLKLHLLENSNFDDQVLNKTLSDLDVMITQAYSLAKSLGSTINSPFHVNRYADTLLNLEQYGQAAKHLTESINLNPAWAAIGYYNRAYAMIMQEEENYMENAINDLKQIEKLLPPWFFHPQWMVMHLGVKIRQDPSSDSQPESPLAKQCEIRFQLMNDWFQKVKEALAKLEDIKSRDRKAEARQESVLILINNDDPLTKAELADMYKLSQTRIYSIHEKPRFCWEALVVAILGVLEVVAGVILMAVTVGAASQFGMALIAEGVSDIIDGAVGMITGQFSWSEWVSTKAMGIAMSLATCGVAKLAAKGIKYAEKAIKTVTKGSKALKAAAKTAADAIEKAKSLATKAGNLTGKVGSTAQKSVTTLVRCPTALQTPVTYLLKETVVQIGAQLIGKAEQAIIDAILDEIMKTVENEIRGKLQTAVYNGGGLYDAVENLVAHLLEEETSCKLLSGQSKTQICNIVKSLAEEDSIEFVTSTSKRTQIFNSYIVPIFNTAKNMAVKKSGKGKAVEMAIKITEAAWVASEVGEAIGRIAIFCDEFADTVASSLNLYIKEELNNKKPSKKLEDTFVLKSLMSQISQALAIVVCDMIKNTLNSKVNSHIHRYTQMKVKQGLHSAVKMQNTIDNIDQKFQAHKEQQELSSQMKSVLSHAENLKQNIGEGGSAFDAQVLASALDSKIVIKRCNTKNELEVSAQLGMSSSSGNQTIEILYHPPTKENRHGHYEALIQGVRCPMQTDGSSNGFYKAVAQAQNPSCKDIDILQRKANVLRDQQFQTMTHNPKRWAQQFQQAQWKMEIKTKDIKFYTTVDQHGTRAKLGPVELGIDYSGNFHYKVDKQMLIRAGRKYVALRSGPLLKRLNRMARPYYSKMHERVKNSGTVNKFRKRFKKVSSNRHARKARQILREVISDKELIGAVKVVLIHVTVQSEAGQAVDRFLTDTLGIPMDLEQVARDALGANGVEVQLVNDIASLTAGIEGLLNETGLADSKVHEEMKSILGEYGINVNDEKQIEGILRTWNDKADKITKFNMQKTANSMLKKLGIDANDVTTIGQRVARELSDVKEIWDKLGNGGTIDDVGSIVKAIMKEDKMPDVFNFIRTADKVNYEPGAAVQLAMEQINQQFLGHKIGKQIIQSMGIDPGVIDNAAMLGRDLCNIMDNENGEMKLLEDLKGIVKSHGAEISEELSPEILETAVKGVIHFREKVFDEAKDNAENFIESMGIDPGIIDNVATLGMDICSIVFNEKDNTQMLEELRSILQNHGVELPEDMMSENTEAVSKYIGGVKQKVLAVSSNVKQLMESIGIDPGIIDSVPELGMDLCNMVITKNYNTELLVELKNVLKRHGANFSEYILPENIEKVIKDLATLKTKVTAGSGNFGQLMKDFAIQKDALAKLGEDEASIQVIRDQLSSLKTDVNISTSAVIDNLVEQEDTVEATKMACVFVIAQIPDQLGTDTAGIHEANNLIKIFQALLSEAADENVENIAEYLAQKLHDADWLSRVEKEDVIDWVRSRSYLDSADCFVRFMTEILIYNSFA